MTSVAYKVERIYLQTGTTEPPGGQHAGTPASAIRATHIHTGLMAECGWHRSDHKNRAVALAMLHWGLTELGIPLDVD
jgi:protein subunit release factor A